MTDQQNNNPEFQVEIPSYGSALAAICALCVALEVAVEAAIFPDELDQESVESREISLAVHIHRALTRVLTEGVTDSEDATGVAAAIAIIHEIFITS